MSAFVSHSRMHMFFNCVIIAQIGIINRWSARYFSLSRVISSLTVGGEESPKRRHLQPFYTAISMAIQEDSSHVNLGNLPGDVIWTILPFTEARDLDNIRLVRFSCSTYFWKDARLAIVLVISVSISECDISELSQFRSLPNGTMSLSSTKA